MFRYGQLCSLCSHASRSVLCCAAIAALATVLLGGCTPMRWERNGYALDVSDRDWNDCRRQSIAGANRWMFDPFPQSYFARDARGRIFSVYRPSPYPSRFMLEQEYLDNCLHARGYQRVPVQAVAPAGAAPAAPATKD